MFKIIFENKNTHTLKLTKNYKDGASEKIRVHQFKVADGLNGYRLLRSLYNIGGDIFSILMDFAGMRLIE